MKNQITKKLLILLMSLVFCFSLCFLALNSTTTTKAEEPSALLSDTKVMVSDDKDYMLIATAIADTSKVYELGYEITASTGAVTTSFANDNKYFTGIQLASVVTAKDIFGAEYDGQGMIVWEIAYSEQITYTIKPYVYVGRLEGGNLIGSENKEDDKQVGAEKVKYQTHNVTFVTEKLSAVDAQKVKHNGKAVEPTISETNGMVVWCTDQNTLSNAYDFNTAVTSDLTLYEKYIEVVKPVKTDLYLYVNTDDTTHYPSSTQLAVDVFNKAGEVASPSLSYTSNATGVATVADGTVTAVGEGQTTVDVKYTEGGKDYTASINVTVYANKPAVTLSITEDSVTVDAAKPSSSYENVAALTTTFTIDGDNADASLIQWSAQDSAIVDVQDGVVTGLSGGTTTVTATYTDEKSNGKVYTDTVSVTVKDVVKQNASSTEVNIKKNSSAFINKEIDLSQSNATTSFLELDVNVLDKDGTNCDAVKMESGSKPIKNVYLKLTDSSNANNTLIVRLFGHYDGEATNNNTDDVQGYYVAVSLNGSTYKIKRSSNDTLYANGYKGLNSTDGVLKLAYDTATNIIYVDCVSVEGYIDLDSTDLNSSWGGFTNNKVYVSMYYETNTAVADSDKAKLNVDITKVGTTAITANDVQIFDYIIKNDILVHNGTIVELNANNKIQYNKTIDLTSNSQVIEYQIYTSAETTARYIYIQLTDVEDSTKELILRQCKNTNSDKAHQSFAYAGISNNMRSYNGSSIQTNPGGNNGFNTYGSFTGSNLTLTDDNYNIGYTIDVTSGKVCYTGKNYQSVTDNCFMNFNDAAYMGENVGVGSGKYKLTVYAEDNSNNQVAATLFIVSINGQKVSASDFSVVAE